MRKWSRNSPLRSRRSLRPRRGKSRERAQRTTWRRNACSLYARDTRSGHLETTTAHVPTPSDRLRRLTTPASECRAASAAVSRKVALQNRRSSRPRFVYYSYFPSLLLLSISEPRYLFAFTMETIPLERAKVFVLHFLPSIKVLLNVIYKASDV